MLFIIDNLNISLTLIFTISFIRERKKKNEFIFKKKRDKKKKLLFRNLFNRQIYFLLTYCREEHNKETCKHRDAVTYSAKKKKRNT